MKFWKFGVVCGVGVAATVACGSDDEGIFTPTGGSAGNAGSTGKPNGGGGNGSAGDVSNGGKSGCAPMACGASAGKGGGGAGGVAGGSLGGKAGMGGFPEGGGGAGDLGGAGGLGEGGSGGAGGDAGLGGAGGEGGSFEAPTGPLAHCQGCTRTKIGSPLWEPTGVIALVADMSSFEDFIADNESIVGPDHAYDMNDNVIGPALAHAGPYDDEVRLRAVAKGRTIKQAFKTSEFASPSGVTILLNIVPSAGAVTGSSFDFNSGPIIANALFPFAVDGDTYRDGVIYDAELDSVFPGYPAMNPPIVKDGPSHLLWFFGESDAFAPPNTPTNGSYEFRLKVTDKTGAGWNVKVPYTVSN